MVAYPTTLLFRVARTIERALADLKAGTLDERTMAWTSPASRTSPATTNGPRIEGESRGRGEEQ